MTIYNFKKYLIPSDSIRWSRRLQWTWLNIDCRPFQYDASGPCVTRSSRSLQISNRSTSLSLLGWNTDTPTITGYQHHDATSLAKYRQATSLYWYEENVALLNFRSTAEVSVIFFSQ
jgi:hypothetical protein